MTDEPLIFIEVSRGSGDSLVVLRKAVTLTEWDQARFPGVLAREIIDSALAELRAVR